MLIIGAGGLGLPAAVQLAAAGVGSLGLMDFDHIELSNLHRQILYRSSDLGRPKVQVAAERIARAHPTVAVRALEERLTARNLFDTFRDFDFVIDATDNAATKYLINDGAVLCGIAFSHAGIVGFAGQTMTVLPGRSACLRCLFPTPPAAGEVATCQEAGVLGPLGGTIGVVQAAEALKFLAGAGSLLANRLFTYDALRARWRTITVARAAECALCGTAPTIRTLQPAAAAGEEGA